jgi:hypothetical protein
MPADEQAVHLSGRQQPGRGGDAGFELSAEMQCVLTTPEESARALRAL